MDITTVIGMVAGACTTVAVVPQLIRTWRSKKVKDVSVKMFVVLITGVTLWCVYGILKNDFPIIITNGLSVLLNLIMMYFIFAYSDKKSK